MRDEVAVAAVRTRKIANTSEDRELISDQIMKSNWILKYTTEWFSVADMADELNLPEKSCRGPLQTLTKRGILRDNKPASGIGVVTYTMSKKVNHLKDKWRKLSNSQVGISEEFIRKWQR